MAYVLGKLARERALIWKYKHDVEELQKVPVEIPINSFMNEVRDYGQHSLDHFLMSGQFTKDYRIEGETIKTVLEI